MEENKSYENQPQIEEKWRKPRRGVFLVFFIIVALVFGLAGGIIGSNLGQNFFSSSFIKKYLPNAKNNNPSKDIIRQQVIQEDSAVIDVVDKSSPAVISIVISKDVSKLQDLFSNPSSLPDFLSPFFGGSSNNNTQQDQGNGQNNNNQKQQIGGGSGFIISSDGMIVTNRHVVEDAAADYTVITSDGKSYPAKVLAKDTVNDIGIVKIEGSNFPTLNLGNSDDLKIGQTVIAIGNSLGEFTNTVSKGIVSGLKRNLTASGGFGDTEKLNNIIQTDAAINPGNSGGPLLDLGGNVIGINVAMAQGAENIGFAIPVNQIKKVISQVQTTGKITTPYLGVRYIPVNADLQKQINLPYNYGVLVLRGQNLTDFAVIPGSPADKAGIVENDVILEINGVKIDDNNSLSDLVAKHNVGEEITLKVWHKGTVKDLKLKLEEKK